MHLTACALFQAFVLGVAPRASSDISELLGSSEGEDSCCVRGSIDPDDGPRGEGQGTLLQVGCVWCACVCVCGWVWVVCCFWVGMFKCVPFLFRVCM